MTSLDLPEPEDSAVPARARESRCGGGEEGPLRAAV
jgi:hypothetical protein